MKSFTIKFGWKSVTLKAPNVFWALKEAQKLLGFSSSTPLQDIKISSDSILPESFTNSFKTLIV